MGHGRPTNKRDVYFKERRQRDSKKQSAQCSSWTAQTGLGRVLPGARRVAKRRYKASYPQTGRSGSSVRDCSERRHTRPAWGKGSRRDSYNGGRTASGFSLGRSRGLFREFLDCRTHSSTTDRFPPVRTRGTRATRVLEQSPSCYRPKSQSGRSRIKHCTNRTRSPPPRVNRDSCERDQIPYSCRWSAHPIECSTLVSLT